MPDRPAAVARRERPTLTRASDQVVLAGDSAHLIDLLAGAVVYRRFMSREPIDANYIERHVDTVLVMCATHE